MVWFCVIAMLFLFIHCDSCDGFHKSSLISKQVAPLNLESNKRRVYREISTSSRLFGSHGSVIIAAGGSVSGAKSLNQMLGGLLSGGLHAVTGPDHIAALLPTSVGKSAWYGAKVGATWGLGHGISATTIGMCIFFLKDQLSSKFSNIEKLTNWAESAVGFSLVAIGLVGMKESLSAGASHGDSSLDQPSPIKAIFANGLLHGFSLDGAPSIAPAIVLSSWRKAALFLAAYSFGTMIAMTIVSSGIAILSSNLGKLSNRPDLPKKLSFFSSLSALLIGCYWIFQAHFVTKF